MARIASIGTSTTSFPFQIITRATPNAPGEYQFQISNNGKFLNTDGSDVSVTMGGGQPLGTWVNLNGNDTIWLEGDVAAFTCSSVRFSSYGQGNSGYGVSAYWTGGGLTESSGSPLSQTIFRKVMAVFVAGAHGQPVLSDAQSATNLQMINSAPQGQPAIYPRPA